MNFKGQHQKHMVFLRKYKENGNLCYHGTGNEERAREAVRGQQKGMSMQEHCNVYAIGDRIQSKQYRQHRVGIPQGGPQLG